MLNLAAVTAWWNPSNSASRAQAFLQFTDAWPKHLKLYRLPEMDRPPIWQKERLLNLAIRGLPPEVTKVIWVDADVLIDSPTWATDVSAALDKWPVVQPWKTTYFLGPDGAVIDGPMEQAVVPSVPYANQFLASLDPSGQRIPSGLPTNAWPGFCWAARREVLEEIGGLYEYDLSGPNDVLMSLAFYGDFSNSFLMRYGGRFKDHYLPWAERAYKVVQGNVGYVPATLTHLWHGPFDQRKYLQRTVKLYAAGYDPSRDVTTAPDGTLILTDVCPPEVRKLAESVVNPHIASDEGIQRPVAPDEEDKARAFISSQTQAALSDGCCNGPPRQITVG